MIFGAFITFVIFLAGLLVGRLSVKIRTNCAMYENGFAEGYDACLDDYPLEERDDSFEAGYDEGYSNYARLIDLVDLEANE